MLDKSQDKIPLRDLEAEVVTVSYKAGITKEVLRFRCPSEDCIEEDHHLEIPFSKTGESHFDPENKLILVWMILGEPSLDSVTLSPSFRNEGACNLHGFVRNGCWEFATPRRKG